MNVVGGGLEGSYTSVTQRRKPHRQDLGVRCTRLVHKLHVRHADLLERPSSAKWKELDTMRINQGSKLDQSLGVGLVIDVKDDGDVTRGILRQDIGGESNDGTDVRVRRGGTKDIVSRLIRRCSWSEGCIGVLHPDSPFITI